MQEKPKNESADCLKSAEAEVFSSMRALREQHGVDLTIAHSMMFMATLTTMKSLCLTPEQFTAMFECYMSMAQEQFCELKKPNVNWTDTRQ